MPTLVNSSNPSASSSYSIGKTAFCLEAQNMTELGALALDSNVSTTHLSINETKLHFHYGWRCILEKLLDIEVAITSFSKIFLENEPEHMSL